MYVGSTHCCKTRAPRSTSAISQFLQINRLTTLFFLTASINWRQRHRVVVRERQSARVFVRTRRRARRRQNWRGTWCAKCAVSQLMNWHRRWRRRKCGRERWRVWRQTKVRLLTWRRCQIADGVECVWWLPDTRRRQSRPPRKGSFLAIRVKRIFNSRTSERNGMSSKIGSDAHDSRDIVDY
jgi:hypothetical protein